jgi:hypothetical protein
MRPFWLPAYTSILKLPERTQSSCLRFSWGRMAALLQPSHSPRPELTAAVTFLQARRMLSKRLPVPAYDMLLKCSHAFNVLDARGAVGVTERADCFATMRALAREVTGVSSSTHIALLNSVGACPEHRRCDSCTGCRGSSSYGDRPSCAASAVRAWHAWWCKKVAATLAYLSLELIVT